MSRPPTDVGGRLGWVAAAPDVYRLVPQRLRTVVTERCLRPRAGPWLKPPLADVTFTLDRRIVGADTEGSGVRVRLDDGSARSVDHIVLGTGFRIDAGSYPFLSERLVSKLDLVAGYPRLGPGLESRRSTSQQLDQAHAFLAPLLGSAIAPTLFGIALLCCGLNSTVTATFSGQIVMEGFIDIRLPGWARRLVTRSIAIVPAAIVATGTARPARRSC